MPDAVFTDAAFFRRTRNPSCSYSNSSSRCDSMKASSFSSGPNSTREVDGWLSELFFRFSLIECQSSRRFRGAVVRTSVPFAWSNFVFQPYSTDSFYINPGFERNHTTCPDFRLLITANPGTLMDFDPKPVARTMHERSPEATMNEQTPGRPVHASGAYTGAESLMRSLLGLLNCFIPTSNPRGCAPQKNRARNVTAVVAEYSTQVQHHQFVFPQAFFGRLRMGQRRTRAGGHDSVKRRCARAFAPQSVVDLRSNIHFRNSGADEIRRFRHDFGSNPRRLAHHIEFLSAFYFSNALD